MKIVMKGAREIIKKIIDSKWTKREKKIEGTKVDQSKSTKVDQSKDLEGNQHTKHRKKSKKNQTITWNKSKIWEEINILNLL